MASTTTFLVLLVLISAAIVSSRPQDNSPQFGSVVGDIMVHSGGVTIFKNKSKKKKSEKNTESEAEQSNKAEESNRPSFSRFIGGPEITIGATPEASVAVASGPALSISGSVITFNNGAQIEPVSSR